jgi:hypothetical protein
MLLEAYGWVKPENLNPETYIWDGNRVNLKYTVSYNRNATAEFTSVILKPMAE